MKTPFTIRRIRKLILACMLGLGLVSMSGCGNLFLLSSMVITGAEETNAVVLPSSASDASAPSLPEVTATAADLPDETQESIPDESEENPDIFLTEEDDGSAPIYGSQSLFLPELTEKEYENFIALYKGIRRFDDKITLPVSTTSDEVRKLMTLLSNDCPELMQLDSQWGQNSNILGSVVSVSPVYTMSKETWESQYQEIQALLAQLHEILAGYTQYQAELATYDYIIGHCVYSLTESYVQTAYGALINGYAKCDGRAKGMVWVLRSFGIPCSVVTGSEHAWVVLYLNHFFYNADPTYDDNEPSGIQAPCSYAYFNIPASAIWNNPYPVDEMYTSLHIPATVRWDDNYHVKSGFWVAAGQDAQAMFRSQLASAAGTGSGTVTLRFESEEEFHAAREAMSGWIQDFLNQNRLNCSMTSYDLSKMNMIFMNIQFQ